MNEIFNHQFSFAELVIALLCALIAVPIWKIIYRIKSFVSDFLARRSKRSLERQIKRLESRIETLKSDLADSTQLMIKISIIIGRGVIIALLATVFLSISLYLDNRTDILLLEKTVGAEPQLTEHFMSWFPNQLSIELASLFSLMVSLVLFQAGMNLVSQLGVYLHPENELGRLNRRVEALKAKSVL